MNTMLKTLKDIISENCISIIMNTHQTKPDYLKDGRNLKNLIKEAKGRLLADHNKQETKKLIDKFNNLADQIDHSHNIESLMLFVNKDIAKYIRLPIIVKDRVVIDSTFATRELIRTMHLKTNYYVLVLSRGKADLIEAVNDKIVKESLISFTIENKQFDTTNKIDLSNSPRHSSLIEGFFKKVDNEVNAIRKKNPLPVLICGIEKNFHKYIKITDQRNSIFDTNLNINRVKKGSHAIVAEAWKIVQECTIKKNKNRKSELEKAANEKKFLSDTSEIWRALLEGRIQTLFIEQDLFQPAIIKGDEIIYISNNEINNNINKGVVDDIYDEMIERNMYFGGDVVFLPNGELKEFNGFGAIIRY